MRGNDNSGGDELQVGCPIVCGPLSLRALRQVRPIESGYVTDTIYLLERSQSASDKSWSLNVTLLSAPYVKSYDSGDADEWLDSYPDAGAPEDLFFVGATVGGRCDGLMTWRPVDWNGTLSLVDIRVRQRVRQRGIGSALVDRLQCEARKREARGITVETQTTNFPAVQFYLKQGFEVVGFNDHLYSNDDLADRAVALFLFWETS